ncbi:MAG: hypothetical protein LKH27_08210 [Prevotella sp.]|jgi:hypothetical protein|nr:hypothetical protein [Prevotella sp.]MCH3993018.1 hypothetical protein [Prevotella sp.]MCI1474381.1 hypothetical protein [Prevotella sp.]MCI1596064.1 hypothetical protein [Prevotella sp.]
MREQSLFEEQKPRDRFGRFATRERAYADRQKEECSYWKLQAEKYRRMTESAIKANIIKDRVIKELRDVQIKRLSAEGK